MVDRCRSDKRGGSGAVPLAPDYVTEALSRFSAECICIESVTTEGRTLRGVFRAPPNAYYLVPSPHFNTVDYMLCLNQFAYLLAALTVDRQLSEATSRWTTRDLARMRAEARLLICSLTLEVHRPAPRRAPISVVMELRDSFRRNGTVFFDVVFDLGTDASGRLTAAITDEDRDASASA